MAEVHIEPIVYIVRFYSDNTSYKNKDPYVAACTLQMCGSTAYISALQGKMEDLYLWEELFRKLKRNGIREVIWERSKDGRMVSKKHSIDKMIKFASKFR